MAACSSLSKSISVQSVMLFNYFGFFSLPQLVKYDVHTTRKINSIHAIFYHILSFSQATVPHHSMVKGKMTERQNVFESTI